LHGIPPWRDCTDSTERLDLISSRVSPKSWCRELQFKESMNVG
jgi:hypothetical protein